MRQMFFRTKGDCNKLKDSLFLFLDFFIDIVFNLIFKFIFIFKKI